MLNAFALNSYINNDPKYEDDFFLVMDHAIDQGFRPSATETARTTTTGTTCARSTTPCGSCVTASPSAAKTDEYVRVLAYWSSLAETRRPYVYGRDELLDSWHTLLIAQAHQRPDAPPPKPNSCAP